jgi:hypothetical protein
MPGMSRFSFLEQEEILLPGHNLHAVLLPVPAVILPSLIVQLLSSLQCGYLRNPDK